MLIEKAGCVTFYYATKIGDWSCDIHASEIEMIHPDGTVAKFKTYKFGNIIGGVPPVKVGVAKYHKQVVAGKNVYVGLYLAEEHKLPEGYTEVK
jgi:hypothetical protein